MEVWPDYFSESKTTVSFRHKELVQREQFIGALGDQDIAYETFPDPDYRVVVHTKMQAVTAHKMAMDSVAFNVWLCRNRQGNSSVITSGRKIDNVHIKNDYL